MLTRIALSLMLASQLAACAGSRPVHRGQVRVTSAELVKVKPDVAVVADADQPVFFAAGSYWLFYDGRWWTSRVLAGPWTLEPKPPVQVAQIDQPFAFTNYRDEHPADDPARAPRVARPAPPIVGTPPTPNVPGPETTETTASAEPAQPDANPTATPRNTSPVDPSVDPTLNMFP